MTLLERLRVVAASLRDFDHADDHMEVDTRDVSALLVDAANAIEATMKERDDARAEVERLLRLATGPHINEEDDPIACRHCGGTGRDSDYASCNCGDAHACRWCGGTGERP